MVLRCCQLLGVPMSYTRVQEELLPKQSVHSIAEIEAALTSIGFRTRTVRLQSLVGHQFDRPTILLMNYPEHCVLAYGRAGDKLKVFDPFGGRTSIDAFDFQAFFSGISVEVYRDANARLPTGRSEGAQISFDRLFHDFGDVPQPTSSVSAEFEVSNSGSASLQIQEVKADCSCIASEFPAELQPGESGLISLTFTRDAQSRARSFQHSMTVVSNDDDFPAVILTAFAHLDSTLSVRPTKAVVRSSSTGEYVFVRYRGENPKKVESVQASTSLPGVQIDRFTWGEYRSAVASKVSVAASESDKTREQVLVFRCRPRDGFEIDSDGEMTIISDVPGFEETVIPIHCRR